MSDRIISLPKKGRLIVVTDIHGNKDDFDKYVDEIWDRDDPNCHIVFTGDLIHELEYSKDLSLDVLDEVDKLFNLPNFHVLLGNHEFCQIMHNEVYKWGTNQTEEFIHHIEDRYEWDEEIYLYQIMYEEFMKCFPYFLVTDNGFFISHAGISTTALNQLINQEIDLFNIKAINAAVHTKEEEAQKEKDIEFIEEMIWSRPYDDYIEEDIDKFLEIAGCKFMIVGHTPQNGCHILGNQLIFDSSFCTTTKYYLDIDLSKEYKDIIEVLKSLKIMEEIDIDN
ncbi:MAG: metallophosphoesterase [Clostridia bacterium]|nr:metallophosphoesterase [Clostridia bacterium]